MVLSSFILAGGKEIETHSELAQSNSKGIIFIKKRHIPHGTCTWPANIIIVAHLEQADLPLLLIQMRVRRSPWQDWLSTNEAIVWSDCGWIIFGLSVFSMKINSKPVIGAVIVILLFVTFCDFFVNIGKFWRATHDDFTVRDFA
jgi:hypothetical protein